MTRTVKKPDERREEIIKAARELFHSKEYDKATMQDLMKILNIAKGTIYHYFSSKEELLEAVVEDLMDEELVKKKKLVKESRRKKLDAVETIRFLSTTDRMAEENEEILDMLHQPGNIILHARQLGRYLTQLAPIYAAVIEDGCEQGLFKTDHPLECAEFLLAGIQFLTDVGFYPWSKEAIERRMAAFPSLLEDLLSAPEGSFDFLVE
ncbi:MAG: TetR/AcrR family transcriptional regulator [Thermodesulfobacteriota bacterium]